MRHWLTRADAPITTGFVKRFDPEHWTVDFPRGAIASLVTGEHGHSLTVTAEFLRRGDLVGLIWESRDRHAHPAHAREEKRDYSRCQLRFRWEAEGLTPLDAINGPTLTIEGRDGNGAPRSWFVRLWNYAEGSPQAADIALDFDALDGGFALPADADRVDPRAIERMFISLVPPDYAEGSVASRTSMAQARVTLSDIRCEGSGSVLTIGDAVTPEHSLRIATAYDDMYHLPPSRALDAIERLGFRGAVNHYIGMSHYFGLDGAGLVDSARRMNSAALAWHRAFASEAKARGFELIWSVSYEILDMFCPEPWKQRRFDGTPAATGYDPPSTLVSPASSGGLGFLCSVAEQLVELANEAGLRPRVQIGEPWWWVMPDGGICLYDSAAAATLGPGAPDIADVAGPLSVDQIALMDRAGALLAQSTATVAAAAKARDPACETLLLAYLPTILNSRAPELRRANLPVGWARPAFDVLQLEDYEWVTSGSVQRRSAALDQVDARLGYPRDEQHYLSGFVATAADTAQWGAIIEAAVAAQRRGCAEAFIWALPQVLRDGLTLFTGEEDAVTPFEDVLFPIEIGQEAAVAPGFSTNIVTSASGHEYRNANWSQARLRFDAGPGVRGDHELESLISFFRARRGPSVAFRFRDPYDHSSRAMTGEPLATDQPIGTGDGVADRFPLVKSYGAGERRRITRPVPGTVRVSINGSEAMTGWMLDAGGTIAFDQPPGEGAAVTAGFLFDVPVRFADDQLEINRATFRAGEAPSVPLVEVRED